MSGPGEDQAAGRPRRPPWPERGRTIRVEGGIKARSRRGAIGEQWWSRRFIDVLESYGMSGRLARGRAYARAGQVLDFELAQGRVTAQVQGSRARPYQVRIGVLPLTAAQWRRVQSRLAGQALFRAKLLAGEMPHEIEDVFAGCGTPLFPRLASDLDMRCSCPDWEVPCKHLAAVCYVLAEEFDRDPFAMPAWRGKSRPELLAALRPPRVTGPGPAGEPARPPSASAAGFWSAPLSPARLRALAAASGPSAPDLLLRMFPPPPVKVRGAELADILRPAYQALAAGDPGPEPPGDQDRPERPGDQAGPPPEGAQTRRMASGRPHQPSSVSRSSSPTAPSTRHSAVTGPNNPSRPSSSNSASSASGPGPSGSTSSSPSSDSPPSGS